MEPIKKTTITVETTIDLPKENVWEMWTNPEHITQWNFAADTWHCPSATNDLKPGGKFSWRMESKDGSMGFDYSGVYKEVKPIDQIHWILYDGRKVSIEFSNLDGKTNVTETFEAEDMNSIDQQKAGWQAILNNFKKHAESMK